MELPLGIPDPIFMCELALELRMPVGELTQRMSAHELGVLWPMYFQYVDRKAKRDEMKQAARPGRSGG